MLMRNLTPSLSGAQEGRMAGMKHSFLIRMVIAGMLAAGAIHQADAIVVRRAPPRAPRSAVVVGRAPRRGMVWTPGFYRWRGGRYSWISGRWAVPPHPRAVWVAPRWRRTRGGYRFIPGRWA